MNKLVKLIDYSRTPVDFRDMLRHNSFSRTVGFMIITIVICIYDVAIGNTIISFNYHYIPETIAILFMGNWAYDLGMRREFISIYVIGTLFGTWFLAFVVGSVSLIPLVVCTILLIAFLAGHYLSRWKYGETKEI